MASNMAQRSSVTTAVPNDLEAFWHAVHGQPRLQGAAAADRRAPRTCTTITPDGRRVLDGAAGLWCTNAGHNREPIVAGDPGAGGRARLRAGLPVRPSAKPSSWPAAIAALAPGDLDHVFFCNSGSEAADTALKIALAYHNVRGKGTRARLHRPRARLSRRRLRRHRGRRHRRQPQAFGAMLPGVDHLPHTYNRARAGLLATASRNGARISPTISTVWSRCTTPPPSPRSSSSRWPARPACCRRPRAICSGCARSATSTASC